MFNQFLPKHLLSSDDMECSLIVIAFRFEVKSELGDYYYVVLTLSVEKSLA